VWKVNNQQLEELAKCGHASVLHELLQSTFGEADHKLPYALRGHKPFLLARDFGKGRWGHPNDGAREVYRFQLGPRAWSKPIYTYDGHKLSDRLPKYEQEAESLAKTLKLAGWEKIAAQIVSPEIGPNIDKEELSNLQVILCWQEDGRFVTINDREKRLAIAFQWNGDELVLMGEVHPQRLVMLESHNAHDTFELPIVPFEEGMIEHKPAEKAGQIDEFVKAIEWRYATKLDHTLDTLLLEVCDRMDGIEGDIGIAYAGHRFNDAGGDDNWLAVRCGNFAWENGSYFQRSAQSLRSAPPEIHSLLGLLVHLQSSGLSPAYNACYGYPVEGLDVIGLFRQDGRYYFACSNSQASCGPVYEVEVKTGRSKLCGFSDRYDWNFNNGARAGGIMPKDKVLEIVTLDEIVRRVKSGETPYENGPPHDMDVPWMLYLPSDPHS